VSKFAAKAALVVGAVALVATGVGALAGAGVLGAAAAGSAGVVAGVSVGTISTIGALASVAAAGLSAFASATAPKPSAQGSASTFTTNPQSGLPYAMGRTRMSGLRVYARTYDGFKQQSKDDILAFVAMLSIAGPIQGIESFTADNELVTFDGSGNAIGRFQDYMGQAVSLGAPDASALALNFGGKGFPEWTPAHKMAGIAHAQWALRFDTKAELYGAGAPEPAWVGKWVKIYDPRLDSTYPGGSGACRALDESTYVWSDNPGLHALTWALGRWQNGKRVCGIGAPPATIRIGDFVECANVCEANGWKVGGVEWTTDTKWETLKRILQAGGAVPTQTNAMIGCLVSAPRTAIATIESRHLLDSLTMPATKSRRDRFNLVIPRYVDENSDWSLISGKPVTEPAYVAADRGQRTKEIDFPLVQVFSGEEAKQPGQLAAYAIVHSREAGPFTFTAGPEWIGLKTGDVVYLNVPEEGLVNQPVLITKRSVDAASGKVSFAAETETYSKHAYALGQTTIPPVPFALTAPDLTPAAPITTSWNVAGTTSGEGFPALLVIGESEMPSADAVIIDYRRSAVGDTPASDWMSSAILSAKDPVSHVIAPLESETRFDVRIGYRVGTLDGNFTIFANVLTGLGRVTIIDAKVTTAQQAIETINTLTGEIITRADQIETRTDSLETQVADADARISDVETVAVSAGEAAVQVQQNLTAAAGELSGQIATTNQVAVDAYNRTAGSLYQQTVGVTGGYTQMTMFALNQDGQVITGIEFVGNTFTFRGDVIIEGSLQTGAIAANAINRPIYMQRADSIGVAPGQVAYVFNRSVTIVDALSTVELDANLRFLSSDNVVGNVELWRDGQMLDSTMLNIALNNSARITQGVKFREPNPGVGNHTYELRFYSTAGSSYQQIVPGTSFQIVEVTR
jgi:hypothetical protein